MINLNVFKGETSDASCRKHRTPIINHVCHRPEIFNWGFSIETISVLFHRSHLIRTLFSKRVWRQTNGNELEITTLEMKKRGELDLTLNLYENKIPFLELYLHETFQ